LCDVGRDAVNHCFKLLSFLYIFLHFYIYSVFAVLLQFADSIKFISGLNSLRSCSVTAIAYIGAKILAI